MGGWDKDYNESSLSSEQILAIEQAERDRQRLEANRRAGYINDQLPAISREELLERYQYHRSVNTDSWIWNDWHGWPDSYGANRQISVCHHCGSIVWKNTIREVSTCNRCHSHNITILRAADVQKAVLDYITRNGWESLGLDMPRIFAARKERLKQERRARRNERT